MSVDRTTDTDIMTGTSERSEDLFDDVLHPAHDKAGPDAYPRLFSMGVGALYRAIARPESPAPPEYVTVPLGRDMATAGMVGSWNMLWEAAQFRRRYFGEDELAAPLRRVSDRGDVNVIFLPRTRKRYYEYAPLFHLLPQTALQRHGLPMLRAGQWPFLAQFGRIEDRLPNDFEDRLSRAWAGTVWRHLMPQYKSPVRAFTSDDPIRLLAHNMDFWVPPVTEVIQELISESPESPNGIEAGPVYLEDGSVLEGAVAANPRKGTDAWRGEEQAAEVVRWTVDAADAGGRLRGILDAVRSHRCEDDFSDQWSGAREDFERKLYSKRSKTKVRFVELTDIIPVHGPESEVVGRMLCGDFMALLDERDRTVVVLLSSGVTSLTEVATIMGYSNHSAVSKRLDKIRRLASEVLG